MPQPEMDIRNLLSFRLTNLSQVSDANGQRWLLKEYGLRLVEWRIMGLAAVLDPPRFSHIARALNIDKGQLSRIVANLTRKELVVMRSDPDDLRGRVVKLTAEGVELYRRLYPQAVQKNQDMVQDLTAQEVQTLFSLLDRLKHFTDNRASRGE